MIPKSKLNFQIFELFSDRHINIFSFWNCGSFLFRLNFGDFWISTEFQPEDTQVTKFSDLLPMNALLSTDGLQWISISIQSSRKVRCHQVLRRVNCPKKQNSVSLHAIHKNCTNIFSARWTKYFPSQRLESWLFCIANFPTFIPAFLKKKNQNVYSREKIRAHLVSYLTKFKNSLIIINLPFLQNTIRKVTRWIAMSPFRQFILIFTICKIGCSKPAFISESFILAIWNWHSEINFTNKSRHKCTQFLSITTAISHLLIFITSQNDSVKTQLYTIPVKLLNWNSSSSTAYSPCDCFSIGIYLDFFNDSFLTHQKKDDSSKCQNPELKPNHSQVFSFCFTFRDLFILHP